MVAPVKTVDRRVNACICAKAFVHIGPVSTMAEKTFLVSRFTLRVTVRYNLTSDATPESTSR